MWNDKIPACFGNGGAGSTLPEWWQVPYAEVVSNDWEVGEMVFDLDGAQNFTKALNAGATTKGFFNLDVENKWLTETEMTLARQGDDIFGSKKLPE